WLVESNHLVEGLSVYSQKSCSLLHGEDVENLGGTGHGRLPPRSRSGFVREEPSDPAGAVLSEDDRAEYSSKNRRTAATYQGLSPFCGIGANMFRGRAL